jgi:oxygen-dependent protoporphyrinogen oxidase
MEALVRDSARSHYPDLDRNLDRVVTQWWDAMLPEFYPGYARRVAAFLARREALGPRDLYFCGDYLSHAHTGGACADGRRIARTAIQHWSG